MSNAPVPTASWRAWALLALSAVLMFLGFVGFGVWPLAFVGLVPALYVVDPTLGSHGGFTRPGGRGFFFRAWFFGALAYTGGFYWVEYTIRTFGGFPLVISSLFASVFWLFQGLQFVLMLWLFARGRERGWNPTAVVVAAYLASEGFFPQLFEHYYGNAFTHVPLLIQTAELGGPTLVTAIAIAANGALYEVVRARVTGSKTPRSGPLAATAFIGLCILYGVFTMAREAERESQARTLRIAAVQANLGLFDRFTDAMEGIRRHRRLSDALEASDHPDLIVWPESSVPHFLDRPEVMPQIVPDLETPLLFGGLRHDVRGDRVLDRNTAFLTNAERRVIGRYDKTYLLAFGEYLPFGETFPQLYDMSPHTGRFSPGDSVEPMRLPHPSGEVVIAPLICYEDIVSSFVRRAVAEGNPDVLINVSVDSWFGDTQEPWVHLSLAQFRAVEHRRWLVRTTITGVSAFIDSRGRRIAHTEPFEEATLVHDVPLLRRPPTLFATFGHWPAWLALLATMVFSRRSRAKGE